MWKQAIIIVLCLNFLSCTPSLRQLSPKVPQPDPAVKIEIQGEEEANAFAYLFDRRNISPQDVATWKSLMRIEQQITGLPLVAGNQVTLLKDGPQTFAAMFAAMREAQRNIHIETFIIDDEAIGREMADILIERRRAGVEVRMIYDAFGGLHADAAYFDRLRASGIKVDEYHPLDRFWSWNERHHRKLLIVDGKVGIIGGVNISEVYASSSNFSRRGLKAGWRDTDIRVEGPAVRQMQYLFVLLWAQRHGTAPLIGEAYFPIIENKGHDLVRIISSNAGDTEVNIYRLYLAAIHYARKRIWITQGYFSPGKELLDALAGASRRGVDVRLLLPGLTDSWITINSSRSHYDNLLASGVRIFERKDALQHAKTAVIDDVWSTVGSANLDSRSFLLDNEANAIIWSDVFAEKMEALFLDDQAKNTEILPEKWMQRPWHKKIIESVADLFRYWL